MSQSFYLVIDQGGHSTRARVYNQQGVCVASTQASVNISHPEPERYEQDAHAVAGSVRQCLQQLDSPLIAHIASAALISQRSSLIACRKDNGEPLTPIISWQDTRHQAWLQACIQSGEFHLPELKQLTGLRLNAHYGASKMRWLLEHDPQVQAAAANNNLLFLPLAAFLTHKLTGHMVLDAVTASRTFLVNFGEQQWSIDLLQRFGIPAQVLPTIAPTRHAFGEIALGNHRIPLTVVGGDQSFLPFACGKPMMNDSVFLNAGTGAFVQTLLALADTPAGLLCSQSVIDNETRISVAEGTVNACASALDWLFEIEQTSLSFDAIGAALDHCKQMPVFHHRISALGSPYWLPAGTSSFSEHASLPEKAVAVIESVIFLLAINIDLLKQVKPTLQHILVSGGIAHHNGFCQKLANCTGLVVMRCKDHEASARGAAFYLGHIGSYPALAEADRFEVKHDAALLARYQHFHLQLRGEWLKTQ